MHLLRKWGGAFHWPGNNLKILDGTLPPQQSKQPYIATLSRLPGWGLSALAFWDYSVDTRAGSNSAFFAPSLEISAEELMHEAAIRFPEIWQRFPPITIQQD